MGREDAFEVELVIRAAVRFVDSRASGAPLLKKALRYLFPDHWSFLLGEIALYSFLILIGTGVYLTLFFEPSTAKTVYEGSYEPLRGVQMTHAYKSVVDLSFDRKAGLLMRQTHHWAANVFIAAIVLHLMRVFFTGAFRKPRDLVYFVGLGMLMVALLEGFLGYSLADDLLSGMGLAIAYSIVLSVPFVGGNIGVLLFGSRFPGDATFWPRMYIAHVFLIPLLIAGLLTVHLALIVARHHTQFRRVRKQTNRTLVGLPAFPGYAPRTLGLACGVTALLFLLGGLVQINPIWLWGPYEVSQSTNGAQPDWYLGWLIGALRLMPGFDVTIGNYTLIPNPFWGGALFPMLVFGLLFLWPWLDRRLTGDSGVHNVLDRPRDAPWRTAIGVALLTLVFVIFAFGSADRIDVFVGASYVDQLWVYRVLVFVLPLVAGVVTYRVCGELRARDIIERHKHEAELEAAEAAKRGTPVLVQRDV